MEKILRLDELLKVLRISRSSVYAWVRENKFPKPIKLGARAIGWTESAVQEWIKQREGEMKG